MKNTILTILNGLPMAALILLYMYKHEMATYIVLAWFLLSIINALFLHKITRFLGMNIFLAITSVFGVYVNTELYYSFVYLDDLAKGYVGEEMFLAFLYIAAFTLVGIVLRITIRYIAKKRKSLKAKRYRIIKLGKSAIEELILDHFIKNQEEYTGTKEEKSIFDYSFDWENKSFIFAVKEEKSNENFMDLSKYHRQIPDTAGSVFEKPIYKDYHEEELTSLTEKF